ncbi:MAG: outer membrane beta-barrel protein [Roseitalea porphyridii]|jgi:outer membrane immunogenic protein|nr:outer membrane beta-barrel protein [Roseitalea porphyridii]
MTNTMKLLAAASIAALTATGAAHAADAIDVPPEPPVSAPTTFAPAPTWSGFYAGAFGGYNFGTFNSSIGDIDGDGIAGGGFAGINFQNGAFVYGAEADLGYSGAEGSLGGATAEQGTFGSLRARLGYAFDPFMIYGTAGAAATQAEVTAGGVSDQNTHLGWTVGAGAEALLTENVFGRLEYRYTDYEDKNFNLGGGTVVSSGFQENSVRAGIGVKF